MKHVTQRISLGLGSLLLVVLLAACSLFPTANTSTPTPVPTPTVAPTATPTSAPAVTVKTYTGAHFSINYPAGVVQSSTGNSVTFLDPVSKNVMTITTIPNPGGLQGPGTVADQSMSVFNQTLVKDGKAATIAPTATVGGVSWVQRSSTGELAVTDPGTQGTLVLLVTNRPANAADTITYEIVYYGPTATFAQADALAFQPMLQSFKFIG